MSNCPRLSSKELQAFKDFKGRHENWWGSLYGLLRLLSSLTSLKCLFTGVGLQDEVVSDSDEPVAVVPLLVEAVRRRDEHVGGEDGRRAHEVSLS